MTKNIEIEFKTSISKEMYDHLLSHFHLETNVFHQVNYYFDTDAFDLSSQKVVLRIRQKGDHFYKVTLKSQHEDQAFESHTLLNKAQALLMIENGFKTKDFFDDFDYFVTFKASLDNDRVSTPYEDGMLFLDRCQYHGITDYEIEYEVSHFEKGKKSFEQFLQDYHIPFVETKRKSERALAPIKSNIKK